MSPYDWMVLAILLLIVALLALSFWLALVRLESREALRAQRISEEHRRWLEDHEAKAVNRDTRAQERHDSEMAELRDNRRMLLAAISQRDRVRHRVRWLEEAVEEHANAIVKATGQDLVYVKTPHLPEEF